MNTLHLFQKQRDLTSSSPGSSASPLRTIGVTGIRSTSLATVAGRN